MTRRKLLRVLPRPDKLESSSLFKYLNCKWLTIQEYYHIADPNLLPYLAHLSNDILVVLNKSKLHTTYFIYFSYICGGLGAAAPKLTIKQRCCITTLRFISSKFACSFMTSSFQPCKQWQLVMTSLFQLSTNMGINFGPLYGCFFDYSPQLWTKEHKLKLI